MPASMRLVKAARQKLDKMYKIPIQQVFQRFYDEEMSVFGPRSELQKIWGQRAKFHTQRVRIKIADDWVATQYELDGHTLYDKSTSYDDGYIRLLKHGSDIFIIDGHHTIAAAKLLGKNEVNAEVVRAIETAYDLSADQVKNYLMQHGAKHAVLMKPNGVLDHLGMKIGSRVYEIEPFYVYSDEGYIKDMKLKVNPVEHEVPPMLRGKLTIDEWNDYWQGLRKARPGLVKKRIINKKGKPQTVWVRKDKGKAEKRKPKAKPEKKEKRSKQHVINSKAFKDWFGDWEKGEGSKVTNKDGEPQETMAASVGKSKGKPIVVYHGTTHEFTEFSNERGNVGNDLGKGFYFTEATEDVEQNYHGIGPDLQNRIDSRTEELRNEVDNYEGAETYEQAFEAVHGFAPPDEDITQSLYDIAYKELVGKSPKVLKLFLNLRNPVELKEGGGTTFELGMEEPPDDFDDWSEEDKDEFYENQEFDEDSSGQKLIDAIYEAESNFDEIDVEGIVSEVRELMEGGGIVTAHQIYTLMKNSESTTYATEADSQTGDLATGEFISDVFAEMVYGVIYDDAR